MFRKWIGAVALAGLLVLATPVVALADTPYPAPVVTSTPYPAPPVTSGSTLVDGITSSLNSAATSSAGAAATGATPASPSTGGLAYTGVSFNVTMAITIAVLVILVGIALVVLGARWAIRKRPRHV